jgi:hypothetical protein
MKRSSKFEKSLVRDNIEKEFGPGSKFYQGNDDKYTGKRKVKPADDFDAFDLRGSNAPNMDFKTTI